MVSQCCVVDISCWIVVKSEDYVEGEFLCWKMGRRRKLHALVSATLELVLNVGR